MNCCSAATLGAESPVGVPTVREDGRPDLLAVFHALVGGTGGDYLEETLNSRQIGLLPNEWKEHPEGGGVCWRKCVHHLLIEGIEDAFSEMDAYVGKAWSSRELQDSGSPEDLVTLSVSFHDGVGAYVGEVLQWLLPALNEDVVWVQGANWASKLRVDSHGGFVIIVTEKAIHTYSTHEWIREFCDNYRLGMLKRTYIQRLAAQRKKMALMEKEIESLLEDLPDRPERGESEKRKFQEHIDGLTVTWHENKASDLFNEGMVQQILSLIEEGYLTIEKLRELLAQGGDDG